MLTRVRLEPVGGKRCTGNRVTLAKTLGKERPGQTGYTFIRTVQPVPGLAVPTTLEYLHSQFPGTSPDAGARLGPMSPRQLLPGLALRLCTPVTSMPTKTDMPARHARLGISLVFVANRFEGSIPAVRYIYIHHLYHLYRSTRWVGNRHTLNWVERQTDRHGSLASDLAIGVHPNQPQPCSTRSLVWSSGAFV